MHLIGPEREGKLTSLPPSGAFLPRGHVPRPSQGSGGSLSVTFTAEIRRGCLRLQGGVLEDGQRGGDAAGDGHPRPLHGECREPWPPRMDRTQEKVGSRAPSQSLASASL